MNTPKGWKQTTLGDLLNPEQVEAVRQILYNEHDNELQKTGRLKAYLSWYRKELEAKEVLPEYLAYLLIHLHNEGKL